jgi:hypothetical protein
MQYYNSMRASKWKSLQLHNTDMLKKKKHKKYYNEHRIE